MLQTLINLFNSRSGGHAFGVAVAGACAGLFLWLLGARFGKSILALVGVALGAWLGLHLPRWYGWNIDGMALGIGGAMVLGMAGYLLHTTWMGASLGVHLALLAAYTAWAALAPGATWEMPAIDQFTFNGGIVGAIMQTLPGPLQKVMPYVLGIGLISGVAITFLWPRVGRAVAWSLLGMTIFIACGMVALQIQADGKDALPHSMRVRAGLLWALAIFGAIVQGWSLPAGPTPLAVVEKAPPANEAKPAISGPAAVSTGGARA